MSMEIEGTKFYTVIELTEILKVTKQTVRLYIRQGKLRGRRIGKPIYVSERDLRIFLGLETVAK